MPHLATPCNAESQVLQVVGTVSNPTYPLFYTLGAETIKVVDGADGPSWQVERGIGDTVAERHTALTALVSTAAPFGGAEQTVRLLGPFRVNHNTPGAEPSGDGALLTTLDAGTIVFRVGVVVIQDFGGTAQLQISLGGDQYEAPDDDFGAIFRLPAAGNPATGSGYRLGYAQDPDDAGSEFGILTTPGAIVAQFGNGTPVQGSADVYILIAEPA